MATIIFARAHYKSQDGESVLATLLRHKVDTPWSCKVGSCHTCLLRRTDGPVPEAAQRGLKPTLRAQGYFLACRFFPDEDIHVASASDADVNAPIRVIAIDRINKEICRIALEPATPLYYHAGQYINLVRGDGLSRSYSLASVPSLDAQLEIHVRRMRNGRMSNWLHDALNIGDNLRFQGPWGDCFYLPGNAEQELVLVGTGTGLAPLVGILRDALQSEHRGDIHLYHGSHHPAGLYLHKRLQRLAEVHNNFYYHACISGDSLPADCRAGRANEIAMTDFKRLDGMRVYLCGKPAMVNDMKKKACLAGAAMNDIFADPFDLADLRRKPRD